MEQEEINGALLNSIKSPELEALTTDLSEIAIDQILDIEGLAKELPIVGSLAKLIKIGISVKDILFIKKLGCFLWHLKDVPYEKRIELIDKLEKDSNYSTDVGKKIMLLLDRADDFEKPKIMANALKAYLFNEITYSQLQRINYGVDHLFIGDINEFISFYHNPTHEMDECIHQNLQLCGFVELTQLAGSGTRPKINELGKGFAGKVLLRIKK